ncbi:hypothetical protein [Gordonia desulfuricans]|uniref:hypothetical protein n=1 Tax=Gordonia desulfuricans TaxID=89051 RepID=UPI000B1F0080|nr:hypothetical protein [Gordonia desulfuricans]
MSRSVGIRPVRSCIRCCCPLSIILIFVAAVLWGRQWGAGVVAALVAFWLVPAALAAGFGLLAYLASEEVWKRLVCAVRAGRRRAS